MSVYCYNLYIYLYIFSVLVGFGCCDIFANPISILPRVKNVFSTEKFLLAAPLFCTTLAKAPSPLDSCMCIFHVLRQRMRLYTYSRSVDGDMKGENKKKVVKSKGAKADKQKAYFGGNKMIIKKIFRWRMDDKI